MNIPLVHTEESKNNNNTWANSVIMEIMITGTRSTENGDGESVGHSLHSLFGVPKCLFEVVEVWIVTGRRGDDLQQPWI